MRLAAVAGALACALAALAFVVAGELNLHDTAHTGSGSALECDNLAGKCLRTRQIYAQEVLFCMLTASAIGCLWYAVRWTWGRPIRRGGAVIVCVAIVLLVAFAIVRPDVHLDDRYGGWWGG